MKRNTISLLAICGLCLFSGADWPQFRGVGNRSHDLDAQLPVTWDRERNVAWLADLPGRGPSSPIVIGNRVFVTASTGYHQDRLHVLCYDAQSGKRLWQRQFWATGRTATHETSSVAAPTPASDGTNIFAFYSSNDLVCLDLDGNFRWFRGLAHDYPKAGNDIGMASSPVVADGVVVVQIECQGDSFAAGIDADTGETRWRVPRENLAGWSSPIVIPGQGRRRSCVLLQSREQLTTHDLRTGVELWRLDVECAGVPSSTFAGDLLFVPTGGLTAFRFSTESDSPEFVWDSNRMRPGSASPVVCQNRVYTLSSGIVKCADATTGQTQWQLRLKGRHWSTPVIAGGHMYCMNYDGEVRVVRLGSDSGEVVGQWQVDERIQASPAISGNAMYLRTDKQLWKIARQ